MEFRKHSGVYTLEVKQHLPISLQAAWQFFSNPQNLEKITPQSMGFQITSALEKEVYEGQIITYNIGILPFFKTPWVTEITHLKQPAYFIDEQRFGPYKMWHHEHFFESENNGVLITDKITFAIPLSFIGHLIFHIFIKNQLRKIFKYRKQALIEIFGEKTAILT